MNVKLCFNVRYWLRYSTAYQLPLLCNKLVSLFKIYDGKRSHNSSLSLPANGRVDSLSHVSERGETVELSVVIKIKILYFMCNSKANTTK